MPNPSLGTIICPLIGDIADVRQDKNGKLYYVGAAGIIAPKTMAGQSWIRDNANLNDAPQDKPTKQEAPPEPEEMEREPTAKGASLIDQLLGGWGVDDE